MRRTTILGVSAVCLLVAGSVCAQPKASSHAPSAKKEAKQAPAPAEPPEPKTAQAQPTQRDRKGLPPLGAGSVFALLPAAGGKSAAHSDDVSRAISEHLKASGFKVLPGSQVHGQLSSHALEGCKNPTTCDPALALATLGADAVISTAVWQRKGAPPQIVVHVRRQHGYGQAEVSAHNAHAKSLRAAAVSALQSALEDSQRTHEIDVLIDSQPSGATVHVDQTLSGTTPAHFQLLPGSHLVSVEAEGYVTSAQYLELSEGKKEQARLNVQLTAAEPSLLAAAQKETKVARRERKPRELPPEPAAAQSERPRRELPPEPSEDEAPEQTEEQSQSSDRYTQDTTGEPSDRASGLNYVVAAVLLGVAAPFIANAIYAGATKGQCVGPYDAAGRCSERVGLGPAFFVSVGVGSAAALAGATFLIVQPLSESGPVPEGAQLQLTHRF